MSRRKKIILIATGMAAALIAFSTLLLPVIVRSKAVEAIQDETGRTARIEKVSINPFTLTVTVRGFAIAAKDGGPFVSIARMHTSLGLASIHKRALILSEVSVDTPAITFSRLAANSYSFTDIIERQKAKPKNESKGELHFSINNITLRNGSLDFEDRGIEGGRKHTVRNLELAVPFISNIPYLLEKYTDPHISAVVDGAPFKFDGKLKPLSKSMETAVRIDLKQLDLAHYVAYSPFKPPADLASGTLTIDTDVNYRISSDRKPELAIKGLIRLDNIVVNLKSGQPLLKLPSFQARASSLEIFSQRFLFDAILFEGMELFVSRDNRGEWMYSRLLPPTPKGEQKAAAVSDRKPERDKKGAPLLVQVATFAFKDGSVHIRDARPAGGFMGEISQIDAAMKNFTTAPEKSAGYELSMLLDNEATFSADGAFSLTPLAATASLELSGFKLQRGWPYLARFLTSPVKGAIDTSAEVSYAKENGLTVSEGTFLVSGLSARYGDKEGFDLSRFEVDNASYSQKENRLDVAEVKLSQGGISLSREVDGRISLLSLLKKQETPQKKSSPAPQPHMGEENRALPAKGKPDKPPSGKKDNALSWHLKQFRLDRFKASFTDKTRSEKPRFTLSNTSVSLANLNGPTFTPAPLRFSSTFNESTPLKARGDITPAPFRYKGSVSVGRLPLRAFEAYFPSNINVFILGGSTDTSMNVDIALKDGKPTGSFKGNAGIRAFHAIDTVAMEDLLKWESLQLDDIQGNLEPFSLTLRQIALNGVYSRIIILKDGTLNLQNLVEKPKQEAIPAPAEQSSGVAAKPAVPTAASAPQQTASGKKISVGEVTIQEGTLSFTDKHLPQQFATTFYNLGGRVSGLSSEESKLADVDLRGNLENHSPLQITGQINPLRDDLFVDLKIAFRDIELSPVTPYSGTYLGYTVEKGKLYLDLKYHIDKKQLASENKIFIDQFTFGEKVESDKATSLPVKLGLALLKDRKGEIHLDVPVTGRTDDPKFSIWRLVFQVLKNLLVKAVTSPFSMLSSMVGGGQDFSAIHFNHGTSTLSPQEEQKLMALSKALLDRPALKVEFKGYVDREKDTEAYRRELLDRKLKNEKFLALGKEGSLKEGEKAETVQVLPEETARYLSAVYKKEKFPKPRNILGMVKDLPPDEMKKLIIANTVIGEPELKTLARERVVAVVNYLVNKGKVPPERVFQKNDDVFKAPQKEYAPKSRVELNAIVQ